MSCNLNPNPGPGFGCTFYTTPVDGICQFITQICGSHVNTYDNYQGSSLNQYGVYSFTIQRPTFPPSADSNCGTNATSGCLSTQNPLFTFFSGAGGNQYTQNGYGNYNNLNFVIGGCANENPTCAPCSQLVTLVYIGAICQDFSMGCALQQAGPPLANINTDCCPDRFTFPIYYYQYVWANCLFSITDSNGYPRRCKNTIFNRNCYLKVAPYQQLDFCVYFAQTRNCGATYTPFGVNIPQKTTTGVNVLVVSSLVPLNCLLWGTAVYIVTKPALCFSLL